MSTIAEITEQQNPPDLTDNGSPKLAIINLCLYYYQLMAPLSQAWERGWG